MGYMHIDNLYKNQAVLMFRECYALEKIHGTSAHITWNDETPKCSLTFHPGGETMDRFRALFPSDAEMCLAFRAIGHPHVAVYGEAYGGKQQAQSWRYGKELRFVVFEVKVGDTWLSVPNAADVAAKLGLEFVHYRRIPTDLAAVDAERDAPSEQAKRNGVGDDLPREGVVLRPLEEMVRSNGARIIAKHKRDDERETKTMRTVDPAKLEVLREASAIADEWVTQTRLEHVMDKLRADGVAIDMEHTPDVIRAMVDDVAREGAGEILDSKDARRAIGAATAKLYKRHVTTVRS